MGNKKFILNGLIVAIILLLANPVISLDLGPVKTGFHEIDLPLEVTIKLWGFDETNSVLIPFMESSLPKTFIGESAYPSENKIDQQVMFIRDGFWGMQNKIKYNFEPVSLEDQNTLLNNIPYYLQNNINGGLSAEYSDDGLLIEQSGFIIDMDKFSQNLIQHNAEQGYTLHLLNLTKINNDLSNSNHKHWYRLGRLRSSIVQDDIRNVGIVGKSGLFYDPSASAPQFDPTFFDDANINDKFNTLSIRITELVENIFVGSPIYLNYNFLNPVVHFDQILIGSGDIDYNNIRTELLSSSIPSSRFDKALIDLFPYFQVEGNLIQISSQSGAQSDKIFFNYLQALENADSNSTGTYIKITKQVAEGLKDIIRKNYYDEWPIGFYFASLIFVDSTDRKFIWETTAGDKEYVNGEIGFGILNLAEWKNSNPISKSRVSIKQLALQNFGKIMGLPMYNNNFASQIDSPMSEFGITDNWDFKFSQFEINSVSRRLGAYYNNSAIHSLNAMRADLKGGAFRWLDRSKLDDAEFTLQLGNSEYAQGNYTGAAEYYIKGYDEWIDAKKDLTEFQGAFYNGIELIAIVLVLLYLISTLKLFTLKKQEFYENIK